MKEAYSCNIKQKQNGLFALRLHLIGGDLLSEQVAKIAEVAEKYGRGAIHITSRQGIEIHNVPTEMLKDAQAELESLGITMGADGNRVSVVIACPGSTSCRYGSIDTKALAKEIDERFFRMDVPYKVKIGVTGCPNNCGKARESDIGVMGVRTPKWVADDCIHCNLCVSLCAPKAITKVGDQYVRNEELCINCSACSVRCPKACWHVESTGYQVVIGGTLGKIPRLSVPLCDRVSTQAEVIELIEKTLKFYKENGQPRERLGHLMTRLGDNVVREQILKS